MGDFSSTKGCIQDLVEKAKNKEPISPEDLIATLNYLFDDVMDANSYSDITDFKVSDSESFSISLNSLTRDLLKMYECNHDHVDELSERLKTNTSKVVSDLAKATAELEAVTADVEKMQNLRADEHNKYIELEKEKGHLVEVKKEYNFYVAEINRLNDPHLASLEAQLGAKKDEYKKRFDEAEDLKAKRDAADTDLNAIKSKITALNEDIEKLNNEVAIAKAAKESSEKNKAQVEKMWEEAKSGSEDLDDVIAKTKVIMNAWNSFKNANDYKAIVESKLSNIKWDEALLNEPESVEDVVNGLDELINIAGNASDAAVNFYKEILNAKENNESELKGGKEPNEV